VCSQDSKVGGPAQPDHASRVLIAVAVVLHEGRVLVGRRERPPLAGLAEFPGGKVHPGESPEAAALREVREEAGIEVRVERLLAVAPADYPHGRLDLRFYLCRPESSGTLAVLSPFQWLSLEDLDRLDFPPANAAALHALRSLGSD
jgi:mutator protein MutT